MPRGPLITATERGQIVGLLRQGKSCGEIAQRTGRPHQTISRIRLREGVDSARAVHKRMADAQRDFGRVQRLEVLNRLFAAIVDVLESDVLVDPRGLRHLH